MQPPKYSPHCADWRSNTWCPCTLLLPPSFDTGKRSVCATCKWTQMLKIRGCCRMTVRLNPLKPVHVAGTAQIQRWEQLLGSMVAGRDVSAREHQTCANDPDLG